MQNRRQTLAILAAIWGAFMLPGCGQNEERPNILFIICDQLSPRAVGWTGQTEVKTPNLDSLAESSYIFTNAYSASPRCAPARHSIYTGVFPSRHWVIKNDVEMNEEVPTIISMLNDQGYTTANIGKMHNAPYHHRRDFQYVLNHEFFMDAAGISHYRRYLLQELRKRRLKYRRNENIPEGKTWLQVVRGIGQVNPLPEEISAERWATREALKFIDDQQANRSDQPFFLHLSYFPPHHPYKPVAKYAEMYLKNVDELALPPNFDLEKLQEWCNGRNTPESMTEDDVRFLRALYFGFTTQLDAALGELFDGMRRRGLLENTIVVFTSDHGDNLGEHGQFFKLSMLEGSVGVPLLVHWPGHTVIGGKTIEDNVSHIDLVPTLLQAAGITPPEHMPGKNMLPLMAGKESWEDQPIWSEGYLGSTEPDQLMLKKGDYKLVYERDINSRKYSKSLHNIRTDPWELHDLAADPERKDVFETYRSEADAYLDGIRDYLPPEIPQVMSRVAYDMRWPADPWTPVKIHPRHLKKETNGIIQTPLPK